jgi:hypothetical protein
VNPWLFVIAAYGITVALTVALLLCSYTTMRRAEGAADALKRK